MRFTIANVKISLKTSPLFLDIVSTVAANKQLIYKTYPNFVVVKDKFTFIIFKSKDNIENHINVTKIPTCEHISKAVDLFQSLFLCKIKSVTVDNIIDTTNACKQIDLHKIIKEGNFPTVKFNSEKFPGVFLKFEVGTAILFHSGKIVFVGCKKEEDIKWLIQTICAHI
jgi:hypothetical protein